ncbi:uncharacterized protein N7496_008967 [Penicillium cataractarum]|uniref:Major facilitator superfamily (MFS) profile domain-containing protein n=1 Tax=Penicillium cataractarum TaxID=2100454 RepID=A0A9W9V587_9EURO|nr:uncharacterized protein N7496_008967 [Penicillium cataractarum]KAJ5369207.1 hypothetical protein N7496_008967 [Penicillium cataractarum]
MPSTDKYDDVVGLVDVKDYAPSTRSDSLAAHPSRLSYEEKGAQVSHYEHNLPAVDGGMQAWLFLTASTVLEALVWGWADAFGIFQDYYSVHEPFKVSENIAVIGTCGMGIAYLIAPLAIVFMIIVPRLARWVSTIGVVIMCLSLALGSFAQNVTHLILTQGVIFGIGGCLAYTPSILFMSEWFVTKKGLAFGIVWAGSGISGVMFPPIIEWLLDQYGFKTTLRVAAAVLFILSAPFLYFHKPRLPVSKDVRHDRLNFHFLYNKVYLIYQLGNTVEALGYFLPTIYLPMYARSLGANEFLSSLTVALVNLASVFGSVLAGFLSDRYHVTTVILISTVGTVLSVFLGWGFAVTVPALYVFCVAYGLLAGGFSSTWSGMATEIHKANPLADATVIFPFMETGRGIGNIASGPLSEALVRVDNWKGHAWGTYGSGYGALVVCTGATALVGGVAVVARKLRWL